ncbi:MAG: two-component regulator propeller domain-containing protein [Bacteroidota bacterium]
MRSAVIHILTASISLLLNFSLQAQEHDYIQYTTKDGLPTNYVYGVVEDDEGYIWAYTENGMAKFDGYTFKHFSTKNGLPGNDIPYAVKDKWGRIWLDIYKGKPATYIYQDSVYIPIDSSHSNMISADGIVSYRKAFTRPCWISFGEKKVEHHNIFHVDTNFINTFSDHFELTVDSVVATTNSRQFSSSSSVLLTDYDSIYYYNTPHYRARYVGKNTSVYIRDDKYFFREKATVKMINPAINMSIENLSPEIYHLSRDKYLIQLTDRDMLLYNFTENKLATLDIETTSNSDGRNSVTLLDSSFILSNSSGLIEYNLEGEVVDK